MYSVYIFSGRSSRVGVIEYRAFRLEICSRRNTI